MDSVCMGRDVGEEESSPSMLFVVAKVKAGRSKKTISGSGYISIQGWNKNQEVAIREDPKCYTKVTLSYEKGHISCAISTFREGTT